MSTPVSGWGRYPTVEAEVLYARKPEEVLDAVRAAGAGGHLIARGLGRSYGDSSLGDRILEMTSLDRFLAFDDETGLLTVEAGVSLSEILSVLLARGWFLPVTPGTRFVTVGGAIASDVHGKNHHNGGTFSDHVLGLRLLTGTGDILDVSRDNHPALFHATCGGMGLTGVILQATIAMVRVASSVIEETVIKAPSLDSALRAFSDHDDVTYSVAWIDLLARDRALGRSLIMLGEHSSDGPMQSRSDATALTVPFTMPSRLLNKGTVTLFNKLYYERIRSDRLERQVALETFFYPLDKAGDWNRLYGKAGFFQYQLAIPFDDGPEVLRETIERIARSGLASPLAVLKVFGPSNQNLLSFPMPGYTLALDFKVTGRALALAEELDRVVIGAGGRLYLTKDSRMSAETFHAGYPRVEEFEHVRRDYGATEVFRSSQSIRVGLS